MAAAGGCLDWIGLRPQVRRARPLARRALDSDRSTCARARTVHRTATACLSSRYYLGGEPVGASESTGRRLVGPARPMDKLSTH
jgi:hypothetical protein